MPKLASRILGLASISLGILQLFIKEDFPGILVHHVFALVILFWTVFVSLAAFRRKHSGGITEKRFSLIVLAICATLLVFSKAISWMSEKAADKFAIKTAKTALGLSGDQYREKLSSLGFRQDDDSSYSKLFEFTTIGYPIHVGLYHSEPEVRIYVYHFLDAGLQIRLFRNSSQIQALDIEGTKTKPIPID